MEVHKLIKPQPGVQIIRCTKVPVWEEDHCKLETPYYTVLYMNIKNKFSLT
jgi:hypothetical protein